MTKPTVVPEWATGGSADIETPSAGKIALGYETGEVLAAGFLNWLHKHASTWLTYLDAGLENLTGFTPTMVNGIGLVMTFDGGDASGRKVHLYVNEYGELIVTYNAYWDGAASLWKPDVGAAASVHNLRLLIGENQISVQYAPSAASWAEGAWVQYLAVGGPDLTAGGLNLPAIVTGINSRLRFTSTTTAAGGSNPPAATAIVNELRAKNTPKAWGTVWMDGGAVTLKDGFNVAAVAFQANSILITLATAMADAFFAVQVTDCSKPAGATGVTGLPVAYDVSAAGGAGGKATITVVYVKLDGTAGNPDITSGKWGFSFVVFGQQNS